MVNPEVMEDALLSILDWAAHYPLDLFPEPDMKRAAELLRAGGMDLDVVSVSSMRRVLKEVSEIAQRGLSDAL